MNKKKTFLTIIFIIIVLLVIGITIRDINDKKRLIKYDYVAELDNLPEPLQEPSDRTDIIKLKKQTYKYEISFAYKYKIQGRVIKTRRYLPTSEIAAISPLDLGMAWGEITSDENLSHLKVKNYGDRLLRYLGDPEWEREHPQYSFAISHNHLIPANKEIQKTMKYIKEKDYIQIEGYLVNLKLDNLGSKGIMNSSTSRTDDGAGACETIYVTDIKWLKEK